MRWVVRWYDIREGADVERDCDCDADTVIPLAMVPCAKVTGSTTLSANL